MCGAEFPNPVKSPYPRNFTFPVFLHGFIHYLILSLPCPGKIPSLVKFTHPVKDSILTSAFVFKAIIIRSRNYQV